MLRDYCFHSKFAFNKIFKKDAERSRNVEKCLKSYSSIGRIFTKGKTFTLNTYIEIRRSYAFTLAVLHHHLFMNTFYFIRQTQKRGRHWRCIQIMLECCWTFTNVMHLLGLPALILLLFKGDSVLLNWMGLPFSYIINLNAIFLFWIVCTEL